MTVPYWQSTPADPAAAIRAVKPALRDQIEASGRTAEEVFAVVARRVAARIGEIDADLAAGESVWPVIDYADIERGTVTAAQVDKLRRRGCLVVRGHFDRTTALDWDAEILDYVERNPDRIRRRPPGTDSGGLGTHLDPGTLDLWMTREYQTAFRHLFDGDVEAYDPWDAAHRTAGPQYPGSTMCSAFRTFQGWTALSDMDHDQGVLHTVPVPEAMAYLLLRDVPDDDMCGVTVNQPARSGTRNWSPRWPASRMSVLAAPQRDVRRVRPRRLPDRVQPAGTLRTQLGGPLHRRGPERHRPRRHGPGLTPGVHLRTKSAWTGGWCTGSGTGVTPWRNQSRVRCGRGGPRRWAWCCVAGRHGSPSRWPGWSAR